MNTLEKVATYLRAIERTQSLATAQSEATMVLRLIEGDEKKGKGNKS